MVDGTIPTAGPTLSTPNLTTQQVCATCKFWQNQRCHCHPPVVWVISEEKRITTFPMTNAGDWCGEHQFQVRVQDQFVVKQTYNLP